MPRGPRARVGHQGIVTKPIAAAASRVRSLPGARGDNDAHNDGYRDEHDEPIHEVPISHSRTIALPRTVRPLSFGQSETRRR